jgi:hypothetical protein
MTASNHMLAGAVIAISIKQPLLVVPIALASHFVLDALPHFGVHKDDPLERNRHPVFKVVLTLDILLAITALLFVLLAFRDPTVPTWLVLAGMLLAWIPDSVWVLRFFREIRHNRTFEHKTRLDKFHALIQRESVHGIYLELVCIAGLVLLISSLQ